MRRKPLRNEENLIGTAYRTTLTPHHVKKLEEFAKLKGVSSNRLLLIALDNELMRDDPFKFDTTLPECEWEEYTYADEAGKILDFMKKFKSGLTLDYMIFLRHDIGVSDRETFLNAFRECVDKGFVEEFTKLRRGSKHPYKAWRILGERVR